MPTLNPRITITLKPSVHAVMKRLSELTGNSQSSMVSELLESSLPVFERMISVLEAARKLKAEGMAVPAEIKASLDAAQGRLEGQLGLALGHVDDGFRPILEEAEKVGRRAGRMAGSGSPAPSVRQARRPAAPLSNRGVTPQENPRKAVVRVTPPATKTGRGKS